MLAAYSLNTVPGLGIKDCYHAAEEIREGETEQACWACTLTSALARWPAPQNLNTHTHTWHPQKLTVDVVILCGGFVRPPPLPPLLLLRGQHPTRRQQVGRPRCCCGRRRTLGGGQGARQCAGGAGHTGGGAHLRRNKYTLLHTTPRTCRCVSGWGHAESIGQSRRIWWAAGPASRVMVLLLHCALLQCRALLALPAWTCRLDYNNQQCCRGSTQGCRIQEQANNLLCSSTSPTYGTVVATMYRHTYNRSGRMMPGQVQPSQPIHPSCM